MVGPPSTSGSKCQFNAPIPSLTALKPPAPKPKPAQTVATNSIDEFDGARLIGLLTASQSTLEHTDNQTWLGKRKRDDVGQDSEKPHRKRTSSETREDSGEIAEQPDLSDEYDPEIEELFNSPTDSSHTSFEDSEHCNVGSGQEEISLSHETDIICERICTSDSLTPPYEDVELCRSQSAENDPHRQQKSQPMLPTPSPQPSSDMLAQQLDNSLVASIDVLKMSKNIAEVKSRILSAHSVITTYTAMKSAYIQVCALSKSLTRQLALARGRISELEHKNSQLSGKLKRSNAKVEELKVIIRSLPDQGEVLRNIAQLEIDNIKKAKEIQRLRLKYGERDEPGAGSVQ
ncbi:hypothetical protein V1508DRAFT_416655 [Lipomyces doorenjongii]|uniref:uncharacterized protein n=1 Tax=Lipomyces doorenjongii TaxID=383834 RepID=UPI0034CE6E06